MRGTSSGTEELTSLTRYAQTGWGQFKACLWKQHLSYWRNPSYNLTRILFVCLTSLICGVLFWQKANKMLVSSLSSFLLSFVVSQTLCLPFFFGRNTQQDLFNVLGSMYTVVLFTGINNCSTVLFCIATERNVFYRERFAQMYNSWAYSLAQVNTFSSDQSTYTEYKVNLALALS